MANEQLVNYVKTTMAQGYTAEQLKQGLVQKGYNATEVDEAISVASGAAAPAAEPSKEVPMQEVQTSQASSDGIKKRNPVLVLIFTIITLGIYGLYWIVSTTNELKRNTQSAPNPWLLLLMLIPFVNFIVILIYYWKYSKAINELSGFSAGLMFVLWLFISPVGMIIAQIQLNKKAA